MWGSYARPPSPDLAAVCFVLLPECSPESGLFVPHHESVSCKEEENSIAQKRQRLVEERGAGESEPCPNVHGIPHETVRTLNHQSARRIKGCRSASSDRCEGEYTPQGNCCTSDPDSYPGNLLQFNRRRADNARPRQKAVRYVDEHEADEERSVSDRTDKHKHVYL